ncbi:MAG TPA: histidine kinase, partial [Caldithrix abyssi]|nr:histidine kinase [Caldithrix abyssi]
MSKDKKNQFRSRIIKYLTSTPFIAVILGSLITYFLPHIFDRYKIDLIKREKVASNKRIFYNDFDKNGQSEKIEIISPWNGKTAVIVYTGGKVLGQYNFDGEFVNIKPVFCADIDNDQLDEVFIFTWQNNHIRLNCFNPVSKKTLFANKFISEYHKINNTVDVGIYPCGFYDVNADGWKEFYFSIVSGFSASLRNMFALNIANDTLYVSPDDCLNTIDPFAIDLDKDGTLEFCGSTQATGNCDSTNSISDFNSWLTVFNPRLKYKFKPLKIGFNPSTLKVCALRSTKQNYLVALNLYSGNKKFPCSIGIYNSKGKRIRQKLFEFSEEWQNACLISNENNKNKTFFIIKQNGQIEEWNSQLSIIAEQKIAPVSNTNYYETDIDKGLKKVRAFLLKDGDRLLLTDKRFKSPLTIDFSGNSCLHYMAAPGPWLKGTELFISGDSFHYYYDYYENPLYFFKYLIYAAVYILVFLLLLLIQKAQKYRDEQKYKAEKKIAELQIKSITNQLDPHFTLNILNSIGALFQKQDRNKVDYIFGKFSKLLRETVMDSDKIETTLENELEYIRNYLELQS